jgi:Cu/Ag efflux protein CusF
MASRYSSVSIAIVLAFALSVAVGHAQQTDKKAHTFRGKVEKVDAKSKTLTVAGENVEGWMGAMTMTYAVDKDDAIAKVKTGDQITATVYDGDFKVLHDVKVVPPPKK